MNGKGDKDRTSDIKKYKNNYERIFGSKPTTTATRPTIIGNLKNAIENDDIYIPSVEVIQELKDYIVNDHGKAEAAPGCQDDYVMSLAIGLEVLRSHYDRITTNKVPWNQKFSEMPSDNTRWI